MTDQDRNKKTPHSSNQTENEMTMNLIRSTYHDKLFNLSILVFTSLYVSHSSMANLYVYCHSVQSQHLPTTIAHNHNCLLN